MSLLSVRFLLLATALLGMLAAAPAAADPGAMTAEEFKLYREYRDALEDPRVMKMPEARRLPAIARNFSVTPAKLRRVVEKGRASGEGLVKDNEAAARSAIEGTPVNSHLASLELVDQLGTVIAYVSWNNGEKERLPQEAAYLAKAIADSAPLVSIVALWSCSGSAKVFTAKIRSSAATRISKERIEDFAATRYLRLFEDVHNIFEGTPPADTAGCGT